MTVQSIAIVATERPERYIKQLVSHMGHKSKTELTEDGGSITVRAGHCALVATSGEIRMTATADDIELLAAVEDVIGRHLVRFATTERLTVRWSPVTGG